MLTIYSEITEAADKLNINIKVLSEERTTNIIKNVKIKFANINANNRFLWEELQYSEAINDSRGWQYIGRFIKESESIMFFNRDDEKHSFIFYSGDDIENILGESYGFEFYITNTNLDYLICFNHHAYLICSGTAQGWVKELSDKII